MNLHHLPRTASKDDFSAYAEEMKLAPAWVDALAYCRDIWIGGVKPIYNVEEDKFYLAAIVSVKNNTNPVRAESILRVAAAREIVKYQSGADFKEDLQSVKQTMVYFGCEGEEIVDHSSALKKNLNTQNSSSRLRVPCLPDLSALTPSVFISFRLWLKTLTEVFTQIPFLWSRKTWDNRMRARSAMLADRRKNTTPPKEGNSCLFVHSVVPNFFKNHIL